MLFIVFSHLCVHNGIYLDAMPLSLNKIIIQWGVLGNLGVAIFVTVSGYFISTKTVSRKRFIDLLTQVWFYSVLLAVICFFVFDTKLNTKDILQVLLPTVFAEYWFFTAYIVLLLISPFINIVIQNLSRSDFSKLLLILVILWVFIPTFTRQGMHATELAQFVMFYLIGAYIRKYPDNCFSRKKVRILCTVISWILLLSSTVLYELLSSKTALDLSGYRGYFYSRNSLFVVGIAIGMFAIAVYSKPFTSRFINTVASCVFGVYLIHDNPFVRRILWSRIFNIAEIYSSNLFVLYAVAIVIAVFSACALFEFIRLRTISASLSNAVDRGVGWISRCFSKNK